MRKGCGYDIHVPILPYSGFVTYNCVGMVLADNNRVMSGISGVYYNMYIDIKNNFRIEKYKNNKNINLCTY